MTVAVTVTVFPLDDELDFLLLDEEVFNSYISDTTVSFDFDFDDDFDDELDFLLLDDELDFLLLDDELVDFFA